MREVQRLLRVHLMGRSVRLAALAFLVLCGVALFPPPLTSESQESLTRASTQETVGLRLQSAALASDRPAALASAVGPQFYAYISPVLEAPHAFNAVGFHWEGALPEGSALEIEARSSVDGNTWSAWYSAEEIDALQGAEPQDTDLLFLEGRFLQYCLTVSGAPPAWDGQLDSIRVTYLDSSQGPTGEEAASGGPLVSRLAALVRPNVVGRSSWGAQEVYRFNQGEELSPPRYFPVQKIIVHHTASLNNPSDPAASVRAIYYYHAVTQGWGDIGYNFVIDQNGRVYEGRYGGPGVLGFHAIQYNPGSIGVALIGNFVTSSPTAPAVQSLQAFLLSKAVQHGIDPNGRGFFVDKDIPHIVGHKDVISTACPGNFLYSLLPEQRSKVTAGLPSLGQAWMRDSTPKVIDPGARVQVSLTVRNSGTASWLLTGTNPVRAGFRWYRPDGLLYQADTIMDYLTPLPRAVAPREEVTVQALLQTPSTPGRYLLRWDLFQERVGWFEEQGNVSLERYVFVTPLAAMPNDELIDQPNDILVLFPPERLRTLPLSRLTLLSNTNLVELLPEIISAFPNERVLSYSNDMLLRYLPDARLKTFSLDRIRTFPLYVQQRLGLAPTPTATATPAAGGTGSTPTATPTPPEGYGPTTPTATSTPTATPTATPTPFGGVTDPGGSIAP